MLPLLPHDGKAQGRGSLAPSRLCNIGNQLAVELLHVVRITEGFARDSQSKRVYKGLCTGTLTSTCL